MGRPAAAPATATATTTATKYPGLSADDDNVPLADLKRSSGLVRLLQTERARHDAQLAFNAIGAYVAYRTGQDRVLLDASLGRVEAMMPEHAEAFTAVRAYFSLLGASCPPQAPRATQQRTTFRVPARINAHRPSSWMRIPSASRRVPSGSRSSSSSSAYSSSAGSSSSSRPSPSPPKTSPTPPPQPVLPAPPPSAHTRTPRTCPQAMTAAQRIAAAWRPPPPPAYARVDPNPVVRAAACVRA
ncbi:uncharacterized protein LOC62_01G001085 [Vanrija pseudolonga]|uniref:Uncharacterized protein n=1 Tax=Vanrija pseudolonga TaxID=143232 RepID=A0AAF0Y1E5_9TREE|nr:hypothetical protein LOC62_01G001085 [Vanrija pseudolonga]